MKSYQRTDLAIEALSDNELNHPPDGILIETKSYDDAEVVKIMVTNKQGEQFSGRKSGAYTTICFDKNSIYVTSERKNISLALSKEITCYIDSASSYINKILVVGLGNKSITADSLGPLTTDKIVPSSPIQNEKANRKYSISTISPGVQGQTGIEALDIIKSLVKELNFDMVILIDSLASKDISRLSTTIQLSNAGITPGSGMGNHKIEISQNSIGVPVLVIGAPTVISLSTVISTTLEKYVDFSVSEEIISILNEGKSLYVTPNDCDIFIEELSKVISSAINLMSGN